MPSNVRQRLILIAGVDGCVNGIRAGHERAESRSPQTFKLRGDDNSATLYVGILHGSPYPVRLLSRRSLSR
jgi:hypothetical protein